MISFTIFNVLFLRRRLILFSNEPSIKNGILNRYIQASSLNKKIGFKRFPFYTKLIDLTKDYELNFSKNASYDIRRSKKEGVLCSITDDQKSFISLYNDFASDKNLNDSISKKKLKKYGNSFVLTTAYLPNGENLVYHSYLLDCNIHRVRLLNSVSIIHKNTDNVEKKAIIGRANCLLHCEDMLYFKNLGYKTYDLGGYSYETKNISLQGINSFKDRFGGALVEESNYESFFIYIMKKLVKS